MENTRTLYSCRSSDRTTLDWSQNIHNGYGYPYRTSIWDIHDETDIDDEDLHTYSYVSIWSILVDIRVHR